MPKVSIVTLCYNYGRYLDQCVASVMQQTFRDFEQIIVDPASTDNTPDIVASWGRREWLRYLRLPMDPGICSSKNAVIPYLDSEYLVFLDADDKVHPQFLEKMVAVAGPKTLVCPGLQEFENGSNAGWPTWGFSREDFIQNNRIFCCSMMPTLVFKSIGGYNSVLDRIGCEDWNLWIDLVTVGCSVKVVPEILFYYRVHTGSHTQRFDTADRHNFIRSLHS